VFGHFEKPLFLELVKHMETRNLSAGSYLFKPGDQDDSIYVVQSGKLKVTIKETVSHVNVYLGIRFLCDETECVQHRFCNVDYILSVELFCTLVTSKMTLLLYLVI